MTTSKLNVMLGILQKGCKLKRIEEQEVEANNIQAQRSHNTFKAYGEKRESHRSMWNVIFLDFTLPKYFT